MQDHRERRRADGALIINEYTGLTRWQLPNTQIDAIHTALRDLPEQHRRRASDGTVKDRYERIDPGSTTTTPRVDPFSRHPPRAS